MKQIYITLLLIFITSAYTQETPDQVVTNYFQAVKENDFEKVATLTHPEAIADLKKVLLSMAKSPQGKKMYAFFGVSNLEQLQKIAARQIFIKMMRKSMGKSTNFANLTNQILGYIKEGTTHAHVIHTIKIPMEEKTFTKVTSASLKISKGQWRLLLSKQMSKMVPQKTALSKKRKVFEGQEGTPEYTSYRANQAARNGKISLAIELTHQQSLAKLHKMFVDAFEKSTESEQEALGEAFFTKEVKAEILKQWTPKELATKLFQGLIEELQKEYKNTHFEILGKIIKNDTVYVVYRTHGKKDLQKNITYDEIEIDILRKHKGEWFILIEEDALQEMQMSIDMIRRFSK